MKAFRPIWLVPVLLVVAVAAAWERGQAASQKDIVDTAAGNQELSTLVTAVKAADLVETLKGDGPFTVFAPTDAAFAKLPEGTLDSLLKPENKDKLQSVLSYHVVPNRITAGDIGSGRSMVETVEGSDLTVTAMNGSVMVGEAQVVQADIMASNGVIHVIDTVLLPKK